MGQRSGDGSEEWVGGDLSEGMGQRIGNGSEEWEWVGGVRKRDGDG